MAYLGRIVKCLRRGWAHRALGWPRLRRVPGGGPRNVKRALPQGGVCREMIPGAISLNRALSKESAGVRLRVQGPPAWPKRPSAVPDKWNAVDVPVSRKCRKEEKKPVTLELLFGGPFIAAVFDTSPDLAANRNEASTLSRNAFKISLHGTTPEVVKTVSIIPSTKSLFSPAQLSVELADHLLV